MKESKKMKHKRDSTVARLKSNKTKKIRRHSTSSSSTSSSSSSFSSSSSSSSSSSQSDEPRRKRRKVRSFSSSSDTSSSSSNANKNIKKVVIKKSKIKINKIKDKQKSKKCKKKYSKSISSKACNESNSMDVPLNLMENPNKSMAPITKEQWEKQQSVVRKMYDETTGRHRLIKGDGEVLEEIVSKDQHKKINQQATRGDGSYFQQQTSKKRIH